MVRKITLFCQWTVPVREACSGLYSPKHPAVCSLSCSPAVFHPLGWPFRCSSNSSTVPAEPDLSHRNVKFSSRLLSVSMWSGRAGYCRDIGVTTLLSCLVKPLSCLTLTSAPAMNDKTHPILASLPLITSSLPELCGGEMSEIYNITLAGWLTQQLLSFSQPLGPLIRWL